MKPQLPAPQYSGPPITILFENESLIAISKPSGVPSVPHSPEETGTAVNFILQERPELLALSSDLNSMLLHRLDNGTSGVLLFGKTREDFETLRKTWKTSTQEKTYRAITQGPLNSPPPGNIAFPLGHAKKSAKRMLAFHPHSGSPVATQEKQWKKQLRGKALPTHTEVLQVSNHTGATTLDWTLRIDTGVMHQIRCHLATLGYPILGDSVYGGRPSQRLWLHASSIQILTKHGKLSIVAPLPLDWEIPK